MRFVLPTLAFLWACMFTPNSLFATSIVPFTNLGEATTYSECVVLARAVSSFETTENETVFQDTKFESIESTKGTLQPGDLFSLRALSCQQGQFKIAIAGDFKPEIGKNYLLFLYQKDDVWQPVMLSYYVFEQFHAGDDDFFVPVGGEGIELITRPDGQAVEPLGVYYRDKLLQQLRAYAESPQSIWDENLGRSTHQKEDFEAADRAVPTGCDFTLGGPSLSRWQDAAIPVYYDDTDNPSGWGGTFSTILSALNDNYTGIDPSDAGSKSYVPNCGNGSAYKGNFTDFCDSDLNGPQSALLIFDDPCNEIPNLNNCAGTLAFGGSYSSSDTHQFDGQSWDDALYGFVVVNNGVPGCLNSTQYERMLTHELTHVYRMGHLNATNYPNQNMNPVCCNAINTKDMECMNYAYPAPAPVELISFDARLQNEGQVKLQWVTESENDNAYFTLERSTNGISYERIQQVPSLGQNTGGAYQWLDTRPLSGVNYYMLSQTDFDGSLQHLGIRAVTVGKNERLLRVNPNPIKDENLLFEVDVERNFDGVLELRDTDGRRVLSTTLALENGTQQVAQLLGKIPAGIYLLRLYDGNQQWTARFLKQ